MNAGRLDEQVITLTPDTAWTDGEPSTDYLVGTSFWASVTEQSGREALEAGAVSAEMPVVVKARWADAHHLTTDDRIRRADGRVLEVAQPPRELGRRDGCEIVCTYTTDDEDS